MSYLEEDRYSSANFCEMVWMIR